MAQNETTKKYNRPRHHGPGAGMAPGEKPKNFRKSAGDLMRYMGRYKIGVFFVMIFLF